MNPALLLSEFKRRRVFRALVGYGIAAFAVLQIVEPVMHGLHWPDAVLSYVVVGLAAGFPIVVSLAWIFDVNAQGVEKTPPSPALRGTRLAVLLVGVGVLAAMPGLVYYFVLRNPKKAEATSTASAAASIAVLPLANLSRDPEQEYFADGLTEELLDMLAKVPGLHVAARTSAFAFKGKNEDARTIGEKLNVATLLEGSVRRAGDQVRITTQLINAANGYHLWSETYDRKLTDVFAVQDDIAQSVVAALKLKLLPGQAPTSRTHRTSNPEAYNQYLLGRQFFNQSTRDGFIRATHAFEKALALDSSFAPAVAALAIATYWVADSAETAADVQNGLQRAIALANQAVVLDPELTEAYVARGGIRATVEWDWRGAASDFQRALTLSPESAGARLQYARNVLRAVGRFDEAIVNTRKATELDPLNTQAWTALGSLLLASGDRNGAYQALNRSLEINPQQAFAAGWLGIGLVMEGRAAEALATFERSTAPHFRLMGAAIAHHSLGHAAESQKALDELVAKYGHSAAYQIAVVYAWRGETDRAFEWLDRAYAQHDGGLTLLKVDPLMRGLRDDPRYEALLRKLNLPID